MKLAAHRLLAALIAAVCILPLLLSACGNIDQNVKITVTTKIIGPDGKTLLENEPEQQYVLQGAQSEQTAIYALGLVCDLYEIPFYADPSTKIVNYISTYYDELYLQLNPTSAPTESTEETDEADPYITNAVEDEEETETTTEEPTTAAPTTAGEPTRFYWKVTINGVIPSDDDKFNKPLSDGDIIEWTYVDAVAEEEAAKG
ncbi:hypothetical protein FACS1894219_01710 [Clostridia bacterium]|nr:hypothetical protein FACS1894219_01710 [Clostridia bacterium]